MDEKQNLENMIKCSRFKECSIPKCPLDYYMKERDELPEDPQCPLRRLLTVGKHKRRLQGIMSAKMRSMLSFVPNRNESALN